MQLVIEAVVARVIQELIKRLTGGHVLGWLGALLAFFGLRMRNMR